jgi:cytochrome c oxidase subunit 4
MKFEVDPCKASAKPFIVTWALLLALGAVSFGSAFLRLGRFGPAIQFGTAGLQVAAVFILFMRLKGPPSLKWIFAGTGFFWLLFLFGLAMTDYSNRRGWPAQASPEPPPPAHYSGMR